MLLLMLRMPLLLLIPAPAITELLPMQLLQPQLPILLLLIRNFAAAMHNPCFQLQCFDDDDYTLPFLGRFCCATMTTTTLFLVVRRPRQGGAIIPCPRHTGLNGKHAQRLTGDGRGTQHPLVTLALRRHSCLHPLRFKL